MRFRLSAIILAIPLFLSAQGRSNFPAEDRNGDGTIDRSEWNGTRASFRVHDKNRDGVLSGNELPGWFYNRQNESQMNDLSRSTMRDMDRDGNGYVDRSEWRGRMAEFRSMDQNRDGRLSDSEFYRDRNEGMRARTTERSAARAEDQLDRNNNGRVEGYEWPYNRALFHQLDTNRDSTLTADELANMSKATLKQLDRNNNNQIDREEWPGGFAQFRDLDANNDGRITSEEYFGRGGEWQRRQRFAAWDTNRDGIIQSTEWRTAPDLFHRLDTNHNSQLEWSEFQNDQQTYLTPDWRR